MEHWTRKGRGSGRRSGSRQAKIALIKLIADHNVIDVVAHPPRKAQKMSGA